MWNPRYVSVIIGKHVVLVVVLFGFGGIRRTRHRPEEIEQLAAYRLFDQIKQGGVWIQNIRVSRSSSEIMYMFRSSNLFLLLQHLDDSTPIGRLPNHD